MYRKVKVMIMADKFLNDWCKKQYPDRDIISNPISFEELAKDYWSIVETRCKEVTVEYGNDIAIANYKSGFPINNIEQNQYLFKMVIIFIILLIIL